MTSELVVVLAVLGAFVLMYWTALFCIRLREFLNDWDKVTEYVRKKQKVD
jgi:hypothetical protein